jgi:hypothetical protein
MVGGRASGEGMLDGLSFLMQGGGVGRKAAAQKGTERIG